MSQSEIQAYLNDIARYPVLSKETQLLHCRRIHAWLHHEGGRHCAPPRVARAGARSLHMMTQTNLRLVVSVAKTYQSRGLEFSDLIQEGSLGLIRGLELYDPTRGYAVSTYVYWWIRQAITRAVYSSSRPIRLPVNTQELIVRIRRYINQTLSATGQPPSVSQIAENTKLSESRVNQVLDAHLCTACISFDALCSNSDSTILEVIEAPPESYTTPNDFILLDEATHLIDGLLALLSENERKILNATFYNNRSLSEIASELEMSRSRASHIQQVALRKIRLSLTKQRYAY